MRLHREDGASAVEFALLTPLLCIFLFGIIGWGLAFLQVQSIRTAVREGARAAATGATVATVQQKTIAASSGSIPASPTTAVVVSGQCNAQNIGQDVTVSYATTQLPGGGVIVRIPLLPDYVMRPNISAAFRCEV